MNRIRSFFIEDDAELTGDDIFWIKLVAATAIVSVAVGIWSHF